MPILPQFDCRTTDALQVSALSSELHSLALTSSRSDSTTSTTTSSSSRRLGPTTITSVSALLTASLSHIVATLTNQNEFRRFPEEVGVESVVGLAKSAAIIVRNVGADGATHSLPTHLELTAQLFGTAVTAANDHALVALACLDVLEQLVAQRTAELAQGDGWRPSDALLANHITTWLATALVRAANGDTSPSDRTLLLRSARAAADYLLVALEAQDAGAGADAVRLPVDAVRAAQHLRQASLVDREDYDGWAALAAVTTLLLTTEHLRPAAALPLLLDALSLGVGFFTVTANMLDNPRITSATVTNLQLRAAALATWIELVSEVCTRVDADDAIASILQRLLFVLSVKDDVLVALATAALAPIPDIATTAEGVVDRATGVRSVAAAALVVHGRLCSALHNGLLVVEPASLFHGDALQPSLTRLFQLSCNSLTFTLLHPSVTDVASAASLCWTVARAVRDAAGGVPQPVPADLAAAVVATLGQAQEAPVEVTLALVRVLGATASVDTAVPVLLGLLNSSNVDVVVETLNSLMDSYSDEPSLSAADIANAAGMTVLQQAADSASPSFSDQEQADFTERLLETASNVQPFLQYLEDR